MQRADTTAGHTMIDFGKLVMERTNENMQIYEAAHREGYRLGFADGVAEAKKIMEATLGPLLAKKS